MALLPPLHTCMHVCMYACTCSSPHQWWLGRGDPSMGLLRRLRLQVEALVRTDPGHSRLEHTVRKANLTQIAERKKNTFCV